MNIFKTDELSATQGILAVLQSGGTNKSKKSAVKVNVNGIIFDSKGVQKCINKHAPGVTPRQFARIYGNAIFRYSKNNDIPLLWSGSAWVSLTRLYANLLNRANENYADYKYWAA